MRYKFLDECINFELKIGDKVCRLVALYRSPSQSQDHFLPFSQNFELTLEKLSENNWYLLVAIGDFNANLRHWYSQDTNTFEGVSVENVASQFGLDQTIKDILENSSSCIELVFKSQPNLIVNSGTHPSLHPNCHHQIIYAKFNLKIHYPPPYTRHVWHYEDSNDDLIRTAINQFNWEKAFENKNVDEKVLTFNKTVLNILSNFIPHELIVCDDKDSPWLNTKIKSLIHEKIKRYKVLRKNIENNQQTEKLKFLQNRLKWMIDDSKHNYYSRLANKLLNVQSNSKPYRSILKTFSNNKKVPTIAPLFHENEFVTDFKKKAELFNLFFAKQCSLISNHSKLPSRLD